MLTENEALEFMDAFHLAEVDANNTAKDKGFWDDSDVSWQTKASTTYKNFILMNKLALIVTEIGEAMENVREGQIADDKIPSFTGLEAELADAIIRIMDLSREKNLRVPEAIVEKLAYNRGRPQKHGKLL